MDISLLLWLFFGYLAIPTCYIGACEEQRNIRPRREREKKEYMRKWLEKGKYNFFCYD